MTIIITGKDFVACIGATNGRVDVVPEHLKELTGKTVAEVKSYCVWQRWKFKQEGE